MPARLRAAARAAHHRPQLHRRHARGDPVREAGNGDRRSGGRGGRRPRRRDRPGDPLRRRRPRLALRGRSRADHRAAGADGGVGRGGGTARKPGRGTPTCFSGFGRLDGGASRGAALRAGEHLGPRHRRDTGGADHRARGDAGAPAAGQRRRAGGASRGGGGERGASRDAECRCRFDAAARATCRRSCERGRRAGDVPRQCRHAVQPNWIVCAGAVPAGQGGDLRRRDAERRGAPRRGRQGEVRGGRRGPRCRAAAGRTGQRRGVEPDRGRRRRERTDGRRGGSAGGNGGAAVPAPGLRGARDRVRVGRGTAWRCGKCACPRRDIGCDQAGRAVRARRGGDRSDAARRGGQGRDRSGAGAGRRG